MSENDNNSIGPSLIKTIGSDGLSEILQDIGEITLDSFLTDGVVKEIPIIGWLMQAGKVFHSVKDYFFVRKIWEFLEGVNEIPEEQRKAFSEKMRKDKKQEERVGETIAMLLDRYDHLEKPSLMAKIFGAYINGEITDDEFLRLSPSIDRAFIKDLNDLLDFYSGKTTDDAPEARRNLYSSNLSDLYVLSEGATKMSNGAEYPQIYVFNSLARKFAKIILNEKFQEDRD